MRHGVLRIALYCIAALILTFGLIEASSTSLVKHTIENSRKIEASFQRAASFVEGWQRETGRLPSPSEFERWAQGEPTGPYSVHYVRVLDRELPDEALERLGAPPADSFVLVLWRGEWEEFFAGWSGESTLVFDPARYFITGSPVTDLLASAGLAAAVAAIGYRLGVRRRLTRACS